jgi:hypothetical protein
MMGKSKMMGESERDRQVMEKSERQASDGEVGEERETGE